MNQFNNKYPGFEGQAPALSGSLAKSFLQKVFTVMSLGLLVTGVTAWIMFGKLEGNFELQYQLFGSNLRWLVMFAPFIFILALSFGITRMSYMTATLVFIAFCIVMGISLSSIFLVYTSGSIFKTFFITAIMFGGMAAIGATTKMDLTKMGSILGMAVMGLFVAMIVNYFTQSETMDYIISGIGVVVFAGLTAFRVQNLLQVGGSAQPGETTNKFALMGALSLYLYFINMLLFLLRFTGSER